MCLCFVVLDNSGWRVAPRHVMQPMHVRTEFFPLYWIVAINVEVASANDAIGRTRFTVHPALQLFELFAANGRSLAVVVRVVGL